MTPQQLVETLKAQHRLLQKYLTTELNVELFKKTLDEHLKLEDEVFYPQYMELKNKAGEDMGPTIDFINQMKTIATNVNDFLNHYPENKDKLDEIVDVLNLRIESEEEGVYDIFLAMN